MRLHFETVIFSDIVFIFEVIFIFEALLFFRLSSFSCLFSLWVTILRIMGDCPCNT